MVTYLKTILITCLSTILFVSCGNDDAISTILTISTPPIIVTCDITNVRETSAICGGNITNDGGAVVTERGVCYGTEPNPTLSGTHVIDVGKGDGSFIVDVTELNRGTQYYIRAYAINAAGISFGEEKSFTTIGGITPTDDAAPTGSIAPTGSVGYNGHECVDLGIKGIGGIRVLWATCNVGANGPEEAGCYVAWGETEPKSYYEWDTYRLCTGTNPLPPYTPIFTKYNTDPQYGTVDNKTWLDSEDDIAHAKWGSQWRLPYEEEWQELIDKCKWEATFYRGWYGFRVIGKNGNSIFLPVWGYYMGNRNFHRDLCGYYWSGSLYTDPARAYHLDMLYHLKSETYEVTMGKFSRRWGLCVRAVHPWILY